MLLTIAMTAAAHVNIRKRLGKASVQQQHRGCFSQRATDLNLMLRLMGPAHLGAGGLQRGSQRVQQAPGVQAAYEAWRGMPHQPRLCGCSGNDAAFQLRRNASKPVGVLNRWLSLLHD